MQLLFILFKHRHPVHCVQNILVRMTQQRRQDAALDVVHNEIRS